MPDTHYLGTTKSGEIVSRKSNRADFTHAAVAQGWTRASGRLPLFGTSADGAARNFGTNHMTRNAAAPEIVPVRIVTAAEFRDATR